MLPVNVKRYTKASNHIEGWFSNDAARLFGWIDEIQKANDIHGDLFEIGCHHGKSAQLLGTMANPNMESLSVCDLFGQQSDNVSRSGAGDRSIFETNMKPVSDIGTAYRIFQKNSVELTPEEIGTGYRFFHIDGGHNPDEALADLQLAAQCLSDKGVIVLDDPFRVEWPGVTEGLLRFLDEQDDFESIVVGCNKIIVTRKSASQTYLREFESDIAKDATGFGYPWKIKSLPFHSANLRILYVPDYRQKKTLGNLIRKIYYATPLSKRTYDNTYSVVNTEVSSKGSIA